MKINHFAVYVKDLEAIKNFYEKYFEVKSNEMYHNPNTGLKTCFLNFGDKSRLEIMTRPDMALKQKELKSLGYTHLAISVGSKEKVDKLTAQIKKDGCLVVSEPRTTGDGCYESCILDPENNQIEITE